MRPTARPPDRPATRPAESLLQQRDRLDQELRRGLEKLGVVVTGADVARAVSAAVGKRIAWQEDPAPAPGAPANTPA